MYNLFQAELFRFFKSTSFKVMLIIVAVISTLSMFFIKVQYLLIDTPYETNLADTVISALSGGLFILISVSFIALFCNADRKCGALKNTASRINKKEYIALTKFFILTLIYVIIFVEWFIVSMIAGKIFLGNNLTLSLSSAQAGVIAMQYLYHITFATIIMMLTILARNTAVPITIGLVWSGGFVSLIYMIINLLIKKLLHNSKVKFDSSKISLMVTMQSISESTISEDGLRIFIVAAVYLAIGLFLSMFIYKKRDI